MKYKTQCICQHPDWEKQEESLYYLCNCKGTKEVVYDLSYEVDYSELGGDFTGVVVWNEKEDDPTDIEEYRDSIWVSFNCSCGDEISFSEGGIEICECGRVYSLDIVLKKNDTHKGDTEYWDKIKASNYKRFGEDE